MGMSARVHECVIGFRGHESYLLQEVSLVLLSLGYVKGRRVGLGGVERRQKKIAGTVEEKKSHYLPSFPYLFFSISSGQKGKEKERGPKF